MPVESALRDRDPAPFQLIETMRWEPGAGCLRLDRHLARMEASAKALSFVFKREAATVALEAVAQAQAALRVRLALAQDGSFGVTTQDFVAMEAGACWTLRVAGRRWTAATVS